MMNVNKRFTLVLVLCCVLMLTGCSGDTPVDPPATANPLENTAVKDSIFRIEVLSCRLTDSLSTTQSVVQYDGQTQLVPHEQTPGEGNAFLIIELVVEKQKPGAGSFRWTDVSVIDANGKVYSRHPNDTFLELYGFPRMKSTNLNFGRSEGYICFEITKDSAAKALSLVYATEDGETQVVLHPQPIE